jgi:hypothetical protein
MNKKRGSSWRNAKLALGVTLALTAGITAYKGCTYLKDKFKSEIDQGTFLKYAGESIDSQTLKIRTHDLEGRKIGWTSRIMILDADQYDSDKGFPAEFTVNPSRRLNMVWEQKKKESNNRAVNTFFDEKVKKYSLQNATNVSLEQYLDNIKKSVDVVNNNIDWKIVGRLTALKGERLDLLEKIVKTYDSKDILAYGLTELSPSTDGLFNVNVLELMLNNYGSEYIELIPAMGDGLLSTGQYQFTSHAVFDVDNTKKGASVINQALPLEKRIPGSVSKLNGDDHHKAAYLFAIANWADLIRNLNNKQINTLEKNYSNKQEELVQIIATAHYNPSRTKRAVKAWLNDEMQNSYSSFCPQTKNMRVRLYADKTKNNLDALRNYDPEAGVVVPFIAMPDSKFNLVREQNSKGYTVFRYDVNEGDTYRSIIREFNRDKELRREFEKANKDKITDVTGVNKPVLEPNQPVYVLVKRK